jgi:hypothetical protein
VSPWDAARRLAAAVIAEMRSAREVTGRRWRRGAHKHPDWCALDHTCDVDRAPAGSHRSEPMSWRTGYGSMVATRASNRDGRSTVEVRMVVRVAADDEVAGRQVQAVVSSVDLAARAALAHVQAQLGPADARELPARDW